jgi:hypothetical protein
MTWWLQRRRRIDLSATVKLPVANGGLGSKALVRSLMLNGEFYVTIFDMALTCSFKKTIVARIERDPAFGKALMDEAATLFLRDEPETARVILRDLVGSHFRRDWRPFESGN